jgi:hypothetical protein
MTSLYQLAHFLNKGGCSSCSSVSMTSELFFIPVSDERCHYKPDEQPHDEPDGSMFDEASYYQSYYNGNDDRDVPSSFHKCVYQNAFF